MSLTKFNNEKLLELLCTELEVNKLALRERYLLNREAFGIGHVVQDNLLPPEIVKEIYEAFPPVSSFWREISSFRENKFTSKDFDSVASILGQITFSLQSKEVLKIMEEITGIKDLKGDPTLYAGGLSAMGDGDFLNPHIDNSHNQERTMYRRVNALFYVTPGWEEEFGGNLELWDPKVLNQVTLASRFNRLILMETNSRSWHSVSPVQCSNGKLRCCVSNYYFSKESPTGEDYYHVTSFSGRPDQPLKRAMSKVDNGFRSMVRLIAKDGLGKKDQYKAKK